MATGRISARGDRPRRRRLTRRFGRLRLALLALAATLGGCAGREDQPSRSEVAAAVRRVAGTGRGLPVWLRASSAERSNLRRLYETAAWTPVWTTAKGELSRPGQDALRQLNLADADGLRPPDYGVPELDSLAGRLGREREAAPDAVAQLDAALSVAFLRYLRDLHTGRVNPRRVGFSMDPPADRHDYVALLLDGLEQGGVAAVVEALTPALAQYRLVRGALADYRARERALDEPAEDSLGVPLPQRVRQLELALERLRWLRDLPNEPFVLVNIPMFELTAWSSPLASGPPLFRTGVIVGKALDTQTPVFIEEMRYVIFRPYWNVPLSIARNEIIPAIDRDPDYLRRHNMEIVSGQSDEAESVRPSSGSLDRVASGELRIRQRPGPQNALGAVKFVFPNSQNIYLHGTPAEELFDRTRRDFSHGCVRVEDPLGLATWVLSGSSDWPPDRIAAAMDPGAPISVRVNLPRPLTVVLYYNTAFAEPEGTVRFGEDIYGHDARLGRELAGGRTAGR
ncbi:MAG: L,D-transpeptidase family protein [Gemmatimonadales bacterium]